jgi:hypothetical protein
VAAVGDLALLARATDGFVGSAQSSFSVLAWAVASSRRGAALPLRTLPGCRRDGANGTIPSTHMARVACGASTCGSRGLPPLPHPTNWR